MHEFPLPSFSEKRRVVQSALGSAILETARVREKLSQREKPWNREYRDTEAYDNTFRLVIPDGIVHTLRTLKAKKPPGEKFVVMDIMGTGSVYADLPEDVRPDIVIAMTLVDYRTPEERKREEKKGIYVIGTNKDDLSETPTSVALPATWGRFEKLLRQLDISSIDFAVARPLGGMHTIPSEHLWLLSWMEQKVEKHLRPGGILLTEAPAKQNEAMLQWAKHQQAQGRDVTCRLVADDRDYQPVRAVLKIVKNNSPLAY